MCLDGYLLNTWHSPHKQPTLKHPTHISLPHSPTLPNPPHLLYRRSYKYNVYVYAYVCDFASGGRPGFIRGLVDGKAVGTIQTCAMERPTLDVWGAFQVASVIMDHFKEFPTTANSVQFYSIKERKLDEMFPVTA